MPPLFFTGFDEQYPFERDFDSVRNQAETELSDITGVIHLVSHEDDVNSQPAFENVGSMIRWGPFNSGSWFNDRRWFRKELGEESESLTIGCMLFIFTGTSGRINHLFMGRFKKGSGIVTVERNGSNTSTMRLHSSGMDGTDFDVTPSISDFTGEEGTGGPWKPYAITVHDLNPGVRIVLTRDEGEVVYDDTFMDATFPSRVWDWVDFGLGGTQSGISSQYQYWDDFYVTSEDLPILRAKVLTLRPNSQGEYDDWGAAGGTKPEVTANTPPDIETSIQGLDGNKDSVLLGALPDIRPFSTSAIHTLYGIADEGVTVKSFLRHSEVDTDGDTVELPEVTPKSVPCLYGLHPAGMWTPSVVAQTEVGLEAIEGV